MTHSRVVSHLTVIGTTFLLSMTPGHPALASADRVQEVDTTSATRRCTITDSRVDELSGLASHGEQLYAVNDDSAALAVYVLDSQCQVSALIENRIDPFDVEDLAVAADGTLWLADIGDNRERRDTIAIEQLETSGEAQLYRLHYPDGPHDAEALLLAPNGRSFIVTKALFGNSAVYTNAAALAPDETVDLRKVCDLTFDFTGTAGGPLGSASQRLVTGGSVSPDGRRVAVRTYTDLYVWPVTQNDVEEAVCNGKATRVPLPSEDHGEAVSFAPNGHDLLTSTEGLPAPVHIIGDPLIHKNDVSSSSDSDSNDFTERGSGFIRIGFIAVLGGLAVYVIVRAVLNRRKINM